MKNKTFVKFILKQVVGDVEFSLDNKSFSISLRSLSESIRKKIFEEGKNWGLTDKSIDNLINDINNKIDTYRNPIEENLYNVDVNEQIPIGGIIKMTFKNVVFGTSFLELMRINSPKENRESCFLLLKTNLLSLHINDILHTTGSTSWAINHRALFRIMRNMKQYPDNQTVFATGIIENITLLHPSFLYEVIDSKSNFTFKEEKALYNTRKISEKLSFGKNPMTLLLHKYNRNSPIYADFNDKGYARFYSNENYVFPPSEVRDALFATRSDDKTRNLKIITKKKGELVLNNEDLSIMISQTAQADFSIVK